MRIKPRSHFFALLPCYLPQSELIESVIKLLTTESYQPTEEAIAQIIKDMALTDELIREWDEDKTLLCYKPTYFHTEQNLAQLIRQRLEKPVDTDIPRVRAWIERFTTSRQIQLSEQQRLAVETAAYSKNHDFDWWTWCWKDLHHPHHCLTLESNG